MTIGEALREWDELDFLAAGGMLVLTGGVIASLFPRLRKIEVLFPIAIGAAMMAIAGFGARYSGGETYADQAPTPQAMALRSNVVNPSVSHAP
jgi:hypothetical protein